MPRPRGRSPIVACVSASIPTVMNCSSPVPSRSITPSAPYRAPVSSTAVSISRRSSVSSESSELSAIPTSTSRRSRSEGVVSALRSLDPPRIPRHSSITGSLPVFGRVDADEWKSTAFPAQPIGQDYDMRVPSRDLFFARRPRTPEACLIGCSRHLTGFSPRTSQSLRPAFNLSKKTRRASSSAGPCSSSCVAKIVKPGSEIVPAREVELVEEAAAPVHAAGSLPQRTACAGADLGSTETLLDPAQPWFERLKHRQGVCARLRSLASGLRRSPDTAKY